MAFICFFQLHRFFLKRTTSWSAQLFQMAALSCSIGATVIHCCIFVSRSLEQLHNSQVASLNRSAQSCCHILVSSSFEQQPLNAQVVFFSVTMVKAVEPSGRAASFAPLPFGSSGLWSSFSTFFYIIPLTCSKWERSDATRRSWHRYERSNVRY